jgi:hypothetical protein
MTYKISKRTRKKKKKHLKNKYAKNIVAKGKRKIDTTEDESIFEAYLAVLIELIGEQDIYKELTEPINVFGVSKNKLNDPWQQPNIAGTNSCLFIFYEDSADSTKETHFKVAFKKEVIVRRHVLYEWRIKDPYETYQIKNSHGFCQMFAFFIAAQTSIDIGCNIIIDSRIKQIVRAACDSFQIVENTDNNDVKASKYRNNTFMCLRYTLELIEYKGTTIKPKLDKLFEEIKQEKYHAIGKNMAFSDFYEQLKKFNINNLDIYILEILYLINISDEEREKITFTVGSQTRTKDRSNERIRTSLSRNTRRRS